MLLDASAIAGDAVAAADAVSLVHAGDGEPGLRRLRRGNGFRYVDARGKAVRDPGTLSRIRALAVPPAWTAVWISADPDGHIQATGRDVKRRKQYRYHAKWRQVRDEAKYYRLVAFCAALPKLRAAVEVDLRSHGLSKRKVVATVVALMERAQLRVGNDEYTRQNGSYGATTLRDRHAKIHGDTLELAYRGKSGVKRNIVLTDRRLARIVRSCRDLPGQRLFQYVDEGVIHPITSNDVNEYLHDIGGGPFTAKDYRTWAATLGATMLLCAMDHPGGERGVKKCVKQMLDAVSTKLGHTPAVCRSSYIHPRVLDDFAANTLAPRLARAVHRRIGDVEISAKAITVDTLRAIEPVVARYLDGQPRRRRA
ncbi:MAG: DNA topoisomerase IB [Kofleriaceae bacterium]